VSKAQIIPIPLVLGQTDGHGNAAKGGDGAGTHDLRGDKEVDAAHQADGQNSRVQARAGIGEQFVRLNRRTGSRPLID
jgi:hypothetical protein